MLGSFVLCHEGSKDHLVLLVSSDQRQQIHILDTSSSTVQQFNNSFLVDEKYTPRRKYRSATEISVKKLFLSKLCKKLLPKIRIVFVGSTNTKNMEEVVIAGSE